LRAEKEEVATNFIVFDGIQSAINIDLRFNKIDQVVGAWGQVEIGDITGIEIEGAERIKGIGSILLRCVYIVDC